MQSKIAPVLASTELIPDKGAEEIPEKVQVQKEGEETLSGSEATEDLHLLLFAAEIEEETEP